MVRLIIFFDVIPATHTAAALLQQGRSYFIPLPTKPKIDVVSREDRANFLHTHKKSVWRILYKTKMWFLVRIVHLHDIFAELTNPLAIVFTK